MHSYVLLIARRQAARGGNVVMVQVENEYGSFGDDKVYLAHLRDSLIARGIDELLVTSDGPARMWLTGGTVEGALGTVNFSSAPQGARDGRAGAARPAADVHGVLERLVRPLGRGAP